MMIQITDTIQVRMLIQIYHCSLSFEQIFKQISIQMLIKMLSLILIEMVIEMVYVDTNLSMHMHYVFIIYIITNT